MPKAANQTTDVLCAVQEILEDVLAANPEEATPDANFFDDLGGESIDILDLAFRCEKRFGARMPFKDLTSSDPSFVDADGNFSESGAAALKARCPWLDESQIRGQTPRSLFTVGFIARVVQHSIEAAERPTQSDDRAAGD